MTTIMTSPALLTGFNTTTYTNAVIQTTTPVWSVANSPITLWTVTGSVVARVFGIVGATALTSTLNTGTLSVGIVSAVQLFLPTTTVDGVGGTFAVGNIWQDATPTLLGEALAAAPLTWATVSATPIILTIATNNMTAGAMTLYCQWVPISAGATVV